MSVVKKTILAAIFAGVASMAFKCVERRDAPVVKQTTIPDRKETQPYTETTSTFTETSEATRKTLVQHCGRCHQSTLASHKPGAIAVFDLDRRELWHDKLNVKTLEGLGRRIKTNSSISEEERAVIEEFVALKQSQLE